MLEPISSFVEAHFGASLELRARLFNVLAAGGTVVSLITAALSAAVGSGAVHIGVCLAIALLSAGLLAYSRRTGDYRTCYTVSAVAIFMVLFPALFFTAGGYRSGMPAFFVFAVAFTAAMLEGARAVLFSLAELALYAGICAVAYLRPETVRDLPGEREVMLDTVVGFTAASLVLGTCLFLHFRILGERQRRLAELNEILEGANRVKTEFISLVSHEMRAPLAAASVNVQTAREILDAPEVTGRAGDPEGRQPPQLQNEPEGPEGKEGAECPEDPPGPEGPGAFELLEGAQAEIMRLARMVGGMLTLATMSEGAVMRRLDISRLIQGGAEAMRPSLARRGNSLACEIEPGLAVRGVADFLAQVMANLLSNANAHTENGTVSTRAARKGGEIVVSVSDTGSGVNPALLDRVFERGVTDGGTGLGLHLCKSIVESHGGRIWVESEPGRGTTASFALPADGSPAGADCGQGGEAWPTGGIGHGPGGETGRSVGTGCRPSGEAGPTVSIDCGPGGEATAAPINGKRIPNLASGHDGPPVAAGPPGETRR
ncbi:MAG: HAMP domain-containing histidine kinase [Deltaproteobacteria bacterium]|jgi:signal transduction histidine kinase|nr:HAMP domain-containing histidine kinase [Deltaproteobacteria bacterium]